MSAYEKTILKTYRYSKNALVVDKYFDQVFVPLLIKKNKIALLKAARKFRDVKKTGH